MSFVASLLGFGKQDAAAPMALPDAPDEKSARDKANELIRRRKAASSRSIFSSPLGISGSAAVARKTLLGK